MGSPFIGPEVAEVLENLLGGRVPGLDEILPEFLKALDVVGLSWVTRLCNVKLDLVRNRVQSCRDENQHLQM